MVCRWIWFTKPLLGVLKSSRALVISGHCSLWKKVRASVIRHNNGWHLDTLTFIQGQGSSSGAAELGTFFLHPCEKLVKISANSISNCSQMHADICWWPGFAYWEGLDHSLDLFLGLRKITSDNHRVITVAGCKLGPSTTSRLQDNSLQFRVIAVGIGHNLGREGAENYRNSRGIWILGSRSSRRCLGLQGCGGRWEIV
jgi:hypothetical protein